jgi:uncharacterized protein
MRDNVELIESLWDAFGRDDLNALAAAVDDGAEIVFPDSVPWGGTYQGGEGFVSALREIRSNFSEFKAKPEMILGADDDHVVVVANITGRGRSGRLEGRVVWVYRLRGGKVVRAEAFPDTAKVLEAIG